MPQPVAAFPDGPPPAHTGGFGEPTCRACHFDHALNERAGTLSMAGIPKTYVPREGYDITVILIRPGLERAGFELSARFALGENAGDQAGALTALGERVEVVTSGGVQYARQTMAGSHPPAGKSFESTGHAGKLPPDTARWTIRWRAPQPAGAAVVFHVAANAANGDASAFGDFIYATAARAKALRE